MSKLNENSEFDNFLAPDCYRPGSIPIMLTRMDLISLIDYLEGCSIECVHLRNIFIRDLKLCIDLDIDYMQENGSFSVIDKYKKLLNKLEIERPSTD